MCPTGTNRNDKHTLLHQSLVYCTAAKHRASVSWRKDLIQTRRSITLAFQVRIAEPVAVVELDRAVAVAVLNEKFDSGAGFVRVPDRTLEPVGIIGNTIDGDDLSADRQPDFVSWPFPQHVAELVLGTYRHAKGIGQVGYLAARLGIPEIIRRRIRVNQLVTAARDAIQWRSRAVTIQPGAQKCRPVIG